MSPILSSRAVRVVLLVLGLATLIGLVVHIGPDRIYRAGASLGAVGVAVMLLPSTVMYLLDCLGWRFTLGQHTVAVPFSRLFVIRTAGELVNATTPTAYVGGEPLKAHLLKQYSIPMVEGLASVIVAKTAMTIAQIVYILLGIGLGVWILLPSGSTQAGHVSGMAAVVSLGLLAFATAMFVVIQRRGLFTLLFTVLGRCRIRVAPLEARRETLLALDKSIISFYTHARAPFLFSTTAFLFGWLVEAMEVYVILLYLGEPIDLLTALSIDALCTLIKGGAFFVPGSVGAQEAGNLLLLRAFGYSDVTGMTFALLRRARELVWIAIGLLCLAFMMRGNRASIQAA
jgi:uncharacterized protein (TIRG00374 family)